MIVLALLLIGIGMADLTRPHDVPSGRRRTVIAAIVGISTTSLISGGLTVSWWLILGVNILIVVWLVFTPKRLWPVFGLGIFGLIALAMPAVSAQGWLVDWFERWTLPAIAAVPFESFLLALATSVFLIGSGNVIVRVGLSACDLRAADMEITLKGGRVLGPIERLFIFFMALAGQYTALSAVIAAKSILRFPEISRDEPPGTKAEYVLVGSFISWAIALALVPLF